MYMKDNQTTSAIKPEIKFSIPVWADPFPPKFSIEVIRRGVPEKNFEIPENNMKFVIGRAPDCDCVLNDIMVSKYHLLLFYGENGDNKTKIWVQDLMSVNKSKVNKKILEPQQIHPIRDEDVIQLANNEFTLIIHYPKYNEEETNLKNNFIPFKNPASIPKSTENHTNLQKNKNLTHRQIIDSFYKRKGLEPNFKINADDTGDFLFHGYLELPVYDEDGAEIIAHSYSNSKTDIINDLCEEACRIISKYENVFEEETFKERRKRELAENDYYEDEDDIYFDRSGQIESKRDERLNRLKMNEKNTEVETYTSLNVKLDLIRKDIEHINSKISEIKNPSINEDEDDELDKYMNTIQTQIDDNVRNRYENDLKKLKEEEKHILEVLPKLAPIKIMQTEEKKHEKKKIEPITKISQNGLIEQKLEKKRKSKPKNKEHPNKTKPMEKDISKYCDEEEEMNWYPLNNQTGDGITDLNKKFGY